MNESKQNRLAFCGAAALLAVPLASCKNQSEPEVAEPTPEPGEVLQDPEPDLQPDLVGDAATAGPMLRVPLIPKSESSIRGRVELIEDPEGVVVRVFVDDASPGLHGVHIHEVADCSAPDATSAGGHYNPTSDPHGIPGKTETHHLGDLGNLKVDAESGSGQLERDVRFADLSKVDGSGFSFRDRALIVHAEPDTGEQPTGGSGARVACAEITEEAAAEWEATYENEED